MISLRLPTEWHAALTDDLGSAGIAALEKFLAAELAGGKRILPHRNDWFRALELTPPEAVRIVILGQDPYHGEGQAHGLAFSVRPGVRVPPSLANIYKELGRDLGIAPARHGFLEHWARQGVLLLNAVLTVELAQAGAHQGRGWEALTDAILRHVAAQASPTVFMLWGSHAQKKAASVPQLGDGRHLLLTAPHPSPLSAHRGFIGCGHFSQADAFLAAHGGPPIDWALPDIAG